MLFVPFGAALAWAGFRWRRAWFTGAVLSAAIEYGQLFIPGRSTSIGDVCTNSLGTVVGWVIAYLVFRALARPNRPGALASGIASALFASIVAFTGIALRPAFPASTYFGQWTPDLGYVEWYRGRVLHASIADMPLPSQRLAASARVRALLTTPGSELRVLAISGPRIQALGSLFSIFDDQEREVLLIGPDRDDLVVQERTRAVSWKLDQPDMRAVGAMTGIRAGDTLRVMLRPADAGYLLTLNGTDYRLGFTAGQAWALLKYPEVLSERMRALLGAAWLAGILLFVGFWGASPWGFPIGAATVIAVLGWLPREVGLLQTRPSEWSGALCGLLLGVALREVALRQARSAASRPPNAATSAPKQRSIRS